MSIILVILLQLLSSFPISFSTRSLEEVAQVHVIKVQHFLDLQKVCALHQHLNTDMYLDNIPDRLAAKVSQQLKQVSNVSDKGGILHNCPRFSSGSHVTECLSEAPQLYGSHKNLRCIPFFGDLLTVIDDIKGGLWNSKNVPIERLRRSLKPCRRRSVKIIQQCTHVNSGTKDLISEFLTYVTPTCAFAENRCPKAKAATMNTFDGTCPSIAENKAKSESIAASIVAEDTNTVSMVLGIPIANEYYAEKISSTIDGFGESDGTEIIHDFRPSRESGKLMSDESWKERELRKYSDKSGTSGAKFIPEGASRLSITSAIEAIRLTMGSAVKAFVTSSTLAVIDDFMQTGELRNTENYLMRRRSTLSEENMKRALSKKGTICSDLSLVSYVSTRQSGDLVTSSASFPPIVNGTGETMFIVTKVAVRQKTTGKGTRTIRIPMSIQKAKINRVQPRTTRMSMEHRSAHSGWKVFNKRLARSQCLNLNYISKNKSPTQIYARSPRCENPESPERRRCPKGKHDSFARCANKDSSEKPEVVSRFEELSEQRSEYMRTARESTRKEFGKDALCQGFNYKFNEDKTLDRKINISTYRARLSVKKRDDPFSVKVKKRKMRNENRTIYVSETLDRKKWKYEHNARQAITDRIKSTYKLWKERNGGYDAKQKRTAIVPSIKACEILPQNESVRDVIMTIENFFKKNGSRIRRLESRRKKKMTKRRRQGRIIRPKGRKHNKIHVKSHTRKSVCVHQNRRRKFIRRRVASK